ncbi:MAG TPA: ATP phosphoribosyltransferase regulatory subunit [Candidatus Manganitrophaceae bacterium]|nr:ATP phosphoribosyltransferase regulatory subunit [Candidatus Manganitrophaceae bacterium]
MRLSNKPKTMIPKGVATFLPEGTSRRRAVERKVLGVFNRWGYEEVITPIFEYLDVFSLGVGEDLLNRAYKFVDRATGRMMVLRPDVTPQIARMAATLLNNEPLPLRLCYSANVFRHEEEHAGREREIFQVGGELIGPSNAEADAEIIALAIEILRELGLKSFKIALGQMAFTRGVLRSFEGDPPLFKRILHSVSKKEASQLEELLEGEMVSASSGNHSPKVKVGLKTRRKVLSLLNLVGGEEVFSEALSLADHPSCRAGLKRLKEVYAILKRAGHQEFLLIDLGEVRGFDYYTGTIFEVFSEGVGSELGGGGRYDHLLEKFGSPASSTGFAFDIERLQWALEKVSRKEEGYSSADFLVLHTEEAASQAMALSDQLRAAGWRVVRSNGFRKGMGPYLADARKRKINKILVLTQAAPQSALRLIDVRTGAERTETTQNILNKAKVEAEG